MIKIVVKLLKKLIYKIIFCIKLWEMDDWWHFTGGSCFGLFPPSFYYTHTQEEIDRITNETLERCTALINKLDEY